MWLKKRRKRRCVDETLQQDMHEDGEQVLDSFNVTKRVNSGSDNKSYCYETYVESSDDYISFNSKSKNIESRLLSNFDNSVPVVIDGRVYPTGEHAFQGCKFIESAQICDESERKDLLLRHATRFEGESLSSCLIKSAGDAQRAGKRNALPLTEDEVRNWSDKMLHIQYAICKEKVNKIPEVARYLLSSENKYLVHQERLTGWPLHGGGFLKPENSPFQDGRRWLKGNNVLGKVWMSIREEISQSSLLS